MSQIGDQLLQPSVLFLQLLQLTNLVDFQPNILLLLSIEGLFGNSNPPDQLSEWNSRFRLLQERYHLFDVKSLLLHGKSPFLRC